MFKKILELEYKEFEDFEQLSDNSIILKQASFDFDVDTFEADDISSYVILDINTFMVKAIIYLNSKVVDEPKLKIVESVLSEEEYLNLFKKVKDKNNYFFYPKKRKRVLKTNLSNL